jgi:hypothetical protein
VFDELVKEAVEAIAEAVYDPGKLALDLAQTTSRATGH